MTGMIQDFDIPSRITAMDCIHQVTERLDTAFYMGFDEEGDDELAGWIDGLRSGKNFIPETLTQPLPHVIYTNEYSLILLFRKAYQHMKKNGMADYSCRVEYHDEYNILTDQSFDCDYNEFLLNEDDFKKHEWHVCPDLWMYEADHRRPMTKYNEDFSKECETHGTTVDTDFMNFCTP